MSHYRSTIQTQITLIEQAMKKAGLWSAELPEWIGEYETNNTMNVWEWLQFIHLPMRHNNALQMPEYLAPQISSFVNDTKDHRLILQLIIELDSITSTIAKI